MTGFEPAASSSRTKRATGLRYIPKTDNKYNKPAMKRVVFVSFIIGASFSLYGQPPVVTNKHFSIGSYMAVQVSPAVTRDCIPGHLTLMEWDLSEGVWRKLITLN